MKYKLEDFLPLIFIPALIQLLYNLSSDWLSTKSVVVFFFILPDYYHDISWLILFAVSSSAYFILRKLGIFQRVCAVITLMFAAIMFYEILWNASNAFYTHQSYDIIPRFLFIDVITLAFYASLIFLFVVQKISNSFKLNKSFVVFAVLEILLFTIKVFNNYDWRIEAIPANNPILWLLTKIVGYGMWMFIIKLL